ncbi:hypothetical protein [Streptomyces viridochromogenes]|uniref:hypothetical protein n=1 Tax=Streptomyces viridochromogenes TaxID=1938 RepID=UPI000B011A2C
MPVRGSAARPAGGVGGADPAADDYGVPVAAVARHRGELLDTPVYDGAYARAAALIRSLGRCRCRCRWLGRSDLTVACAVTVVYLRARKIPVSPTREQLKRTRPRAEQLALHCHADRFLPPHPETLTSGRVMIATRDRTRPGSPYGRHLGTGAGLGAGVQVRISGDGASGRGAGPR